MEIVGFSSFKISEDDSIFYTIHYLDSDVPEYFNGTATGVIKINSKFIEFNSYQIEVGTLFDIVPKLSKRTGNCYKSIVLVG